MRRILSALAAVLALVLAVPDLQAADAYPSKPIRIVVPFGPGGIADLTVRAVADKMSQSLRQPVVIENRPGAGGVAATQSVARAEPDGYTLLLVSNGTAVSASLFKVLPYDTMNDLAPISTLGFFDLVIVTRADSSLHSLRDVVAAAREHPGKLNIGTINIGSTQNLAAELFKSRAGVDAQIVPFNGTPALIAAVLGGSVDAGVEILGPVRTQITSKRMRALAVMGSKRRADIADVPTVIESGISDFDVASWNALAAPARTPPDVVARLNREINAAVASPEVRAKLAELGVDARGGSPEAARELLGSEIRRWSDVITRAGIERQ
jgi:tripartite-type tricarboxylate transporter receptor subunit TctC